MDFSLSVTIFALILAIPMSVIANLLTPKIQHRWATTNQARKRRRIIRLQTELKSLIDDITPQRLDQNEKGQPTSLPILRFSSISECYRRSADEGAYGIYFKNTEERYALTLHHLGAQIVYTPYHGNSLSVSNPCWWNVSNSGDASSRYTPYVNVRMAETTCLVFLYHKKLKFFTCRYSSSPETTYGAIPEHELAYGEWSIDVRIEGDNYRGKYRHKMVLKSDGSVRFTPWQETSE